MGVLVGLGRESGAAATGEYNTANAEKTINTIKLNGRNFRNMNSLLGIPELYTTSIFEELSSILIQGNFEGITSL